MGLVFIDYKHNRIGISCSDFMDFSVGRERIVEAGKMRLIRFYKGKVIRWYDEYCELRSAWLVAMTKDYYLISHIRNPKDEDIVVVKKTNMPDVTIYGGSYLCNIT